MTSWLAGMTITAERLGNHDVEEVETAGVVAAAGWTITSFEGKRVSGVTTINILANRSGADIAQSAADSGNITSDPLVCALPNGWRPLATANGNWGNGTVDGEYSINTAGQISVRSISGNSGIVSGTNVRIFCTWI